MRFASIGTPAASRSIPLEGDRRRAGFTLLEALVALALVLTFAAALGPHLFQARRIMSNAGGRVAAHSLLRSLLESPFDRPNLANASREGETAGLRWRIIVEFMDADAYSLPQIAPPPNVSGQSPPQQPTWHAYRVIASVSWGPAQVLTAETVRLGMPE